MNPEAWYYSDPSTSMSGTSVPWVLSSGVEGVTRLRLGLKPANRCRLKDGLPIVHSDDDAEESADGAVSLNSSAIELVDSADASQWVGFRFTGVNLARASEIRSAALQFACRAASAEPAQLVIRAQLHENAPRFGDRSRDLSRRRLTTSEVRWSPEAWNRPGDATASQRTPDLSPLIREVTSQPGWKPGSAIVFLVSGQGQRIATGYLGPRTTTAMLVVDADEASPDAASDRSTGSYRVKLHFGSSASVAGVRRVFDVAVPGEGRIENVTLTGKAGEAVLKTLERVRLSDALVLEFTPKKGSALLCGIELHLEEP
jgi:hypothetical protein